jgi:carbamoyltransferase
MKPTLAIYGIKDRNTELENPAYTHDHNLCLMQDGKVVTYLHLERFTRRKYDNRLERYIEPILEELFGKEAQEFDLVSVNSFVGNAFISQNGRLRFEAQSAAAERLQFPLTPGFAYWQAQAWKGYDLEAYLCSQELAHIGACLPFWGAFKENSLLLHFDGGASQGNFSAFIYRGGKLQLLECHWELSYLSKFFNDNALNFMILGAKPATHCSLPGKLMGYAALGNYNQKIEDWLRINRYFCDYWQKEDEILESIAKYFGKKIANFFTEEKFFQDIAATFQFIFTRELLKKIETLQQKVNADYLYYSGGGALNIAANTALLEKKWFSDVFIPPCCNDSGLSLGAAALLEMQKGNSIALHSPYLNNYGLTPAQTSAPSAELIHNVANLLLENKIIGVCNGFGEIGPRALGNRSIIALPNCRKLAQKVSVTCKNREWYRPVAPIMLEECAEKATGKKISKLARYMLLDYSILPQYREALQGVTHYNGTARIQTIRSEKENPFLFSLLKYLYQSYQILGLINTSFNRQGEPIVHTPEQALISAKNMGLDAVIINNQLQYI